MFRSSMLSTSIQQTAMHRTILCLMAMSLSLWPGMNAQCRSSHARTHVRAATDDGLQISIQPARQQQRRRFRSQHLYRHLQAQLLASALCQQTSMSRRQAEAVSHQQPVPMPEATTTLGVKASFRRRLALSSSQSMRLRTRPSRPRCTT